MVTLEEAKNYLRVEHSEDDELIQSLLLTAKQTVQDVGRVSAEQYEQDETCHTATLYAVAYLYTHRENADHNALLLTLRAMLFAQREGDLTWQYRLQRETSVSPCSRTKR